MSTVVGLKLVQLYHRHMKYVVTNRASSDHKSKLVCISQSPASEKQDQTETGNTTSLMYTRPREAVNVRRSAV